MDLENIIDGNNYCFDSKINEFFSDLATEIDNFYPGYGKTRSYVFVIENKKNVVIDGKGAELVFHGNVSPFLFRKCENIVLKNFKIDYAIPGYACGKIINVTDDYYDLDFSDGEFCAEVTDDGSLRFFDNYGERDIKVRCPIVDELDGETHIPFNSRYFLRVDSFEPSDGLIASMYRRSWFECLEKNIIRIYAERDWSKEKKHKVGNYILFDILGRNNVNFEFENCTNVRLENIDMYASLGMGIVTANCRNIHFNSVNSIVRKDSGRILAVKDDVFHLVSTKEQVIVENCILEGMIDDALNIHSFYPTIVDIIDSNSVIIEIFCPQNKMLDFYNNGQKLKLLKNDYTDTDIFYTIKEHSHISEKRIKLTFEEELDKIVSNGYLFDDSYDAATLLMRNCKISNTTGRVVIQTPSTAIVENCIFNTVADAITVNGRSKTYSESAPVNEVIIRNNICCNLLRKEIRRRVLY